MRDSQNPVQPSALPLHTLSNVCCTSGACHATTTWPMEHAQDGWLQLDGTAESATPVDLFSFSSRGVGVVIPARYPIHPGSRGTLTTQAHGAGCNERQVRCCWHRPHPLNPQLQCVGLRFDVTSVP